LTDNTGAVQGDELKLIRITKRVGRRTLINSASLDIPAGGIVALFGPSGCGKTTTLRLIAGLETPDLGEIWIGTQRVAADGFNLIPPRARGIGFVFQDLALWPHLTVAGNLDFVLASAGVPGRERFDQIAEALRMVRIEELAQNYPGKLSGGEQQRAALARALVGRPRLLLLDEPMSNLDERLKADLLSEFAALQRSLRITTIYVTHNRSEIAALACATARMAEGRIEIGLDREETSVPAPASKISQGATGWRRGRP
jgi:ABC-type sugar transport system ATPase subunit